MSAGSGASNLGYGNSAPLSNVNSQFVNKVSSNWAGSFSSNEVPGLPGLAGAKSNVDAAAGIVPGIKGGAKKLKRKIKNITKRYKRMKAGSKKMRSLKRKLRYRAASRRMARSLAGGRRRRSRRQRGGYSQYQNNQPFSMGYSVGSANLPASQLALANPPPIQSYNSAIDNLNAYTMRGFPSKGH